MSGNQQDNMEATSWKTIYQQCYSSLVQVLPMSDLAFIAQLEVDGLLPDNTKQTVQAEPTPADKAVCFLHKVVDPVLHGSDRFCKLLVLMKKIDNYLLKMVADNFLGGVL